MRLVMIMNRDMKPAVMTVMIKENMAAIRAVASLPCFISLISHNPPAPFFLSFFHSLYDRVFRYLFSPAREVSMVVMSPTAMLDKPEG